jgi:hypothetical protein
MKCPKCGYTSFPYLGSCGKCGRQLAEARKLYGVYALPPNPPDLMLAAEPVPLESADMVPRETMSSPTIDLSQLNEIDLVLASPDEASPDAVEGQTYLQVLEESMPMLDAELLQDGETRPLPLAPAPNPDTRPDTPRQPALDLSSRADLKLERANVSAELPPPMDPDKRPTTRDVEQVFELDLEDEAESLTLRPVAEGSPVNDENDENDPEYILEIEEELELEVEELDLEVDSDDEAPHEDENDRPL